MKDFKEQAEQVCWAIKQLANNEFALNNFCSYLSMHFDSWLEKYANTPNDMAFEFVSFANIEK